MVRITSLMRTRLSVCGLVIFGGLESEKVPKFGDFRANLVEFRVRKGYFVFQLGHLWLVNTIYRIRRVNLTGLLVFVLTRFYCIRKYFRLIGSST